MWDAGAGRAERIGRILRVQADRHTEVDAGRGRRHRRGGRRQSGAGRHDAVHPATLRCCWKRRRRPNRWSRWRSRRARSRGRATAGGEPSPRSSSEDPSLAVRTDPETGQTLLSGRGELHLEVAVEQMRQANGLAVTVGRPQVAYRETRRARRVRAALPARQAGRRRGPVRPRRARRRAAGRRRVRVRVDGHRRAGAARVCPGGRGRLPGRARRRSAGRAPGGRRCGSRSPTARTHPKDSSELAFRAAGRFGLRAALRACTMAVLEPVVEVTVSAPQEALGGVLGDLAARRGQVTGSTAAPPTASGGDRGAVPAGRAVRVRDSSCAAVRTAGAPSPPGRRATNRRRNYYAVCTQPQSEQTSKPRNWARRRRSQVGQTTRNVSW